VDDKPEAQPTHLTVGSPVSDVPIGKLASHFPLIFAPCFWDLRKKLSTRLTAELQKPIHVSDATTVSALGSENTPISP
jgi:hypothetical protein